MYIYYSHTHTMVNFTGLFHRVILMSGSAMSDWAIANHPQESTMQIVQNLKCPSGGDDDEALLYCLRKKR